MPELLRNAHPAFRSLVLILLLTNLICGYHFYILLPLVAGSFSCLYIFAAHAYTVVSTAYNCQLIGAFVHFPYHIFKYFVCIHSCHDLWKSLVPMILTCAKCVYINITVLPSLPPSDSLSLSPGYWSFMFLYSHYACAPGDTNNHCPIFHCDL